MASRIARIALVVLFVPLFLPQARAEDSAQRIEELTECIQKNDLLRGQNDSWRKEHCPADLDVAKAQLEELKAEKAKVDQAKAKADATKSSVSNTSDDEDSSGSTSTGASSSTSKKGRSKGVKSTSATQPAGFTSSLPAFAAGDRLQAETPPAAPCSALGSFGTPSVPFADLGLFSFSGIDQVEATCNSVLSAFSGLTLGLPAVLGLEVPSLILPAQADVSDLTVDKVSLTIGGTEEDEFQSGDIFKYEITVTNEAIPDAVAATNVMLTDDHPDDLTYLSSTVSPSAGRSCQQTLTAGSFTCNLGTIGVGEEVTVTVFTEIPEAFCSQNDVATQPLPKNSVSVSSSNETVPEGNFDSAIIEVDCSSVHIIKEGPDDPVTPGDTILYTINVANWPKTIDENVGRATGVVVTDDFLPGFTIVSVSPGCTVSAGNLVTCQIGTLEEEANEDDAVGKTVFIRVKVGPELGCDESVRNTAEVTALNEWPFHTYDNDDSWSIAVECAPNVVITKTASDVDAGGTITYTISAHNNGTAEAENVIVTDNLNDALTGVTATGNPGTCVVGAGNTVSCDLGEIGIGATDTVTITATVPESACPSITNSAAGAASNEPEGLRDDNTASVTTEIGDCVEGVGFTRAEVVEVLAATGAPIGALAVAAASLFGLGGGLMVAGRRRRSRRW